MGKVSTEPQVNNKHMLHDKLPDDIGQSENKAVGIENALLHEMLGKIQQSEIGAADRSSNNAAIRTLEVTEQS